MYKFFVQINFILQYHFSLNVINNCFRWTKKWVGNLFSYFCYDGLRIYQNKNYFLPKLHIRTVQYSTVQYSTVQYVILKVLLMLKLVFSFTLAGIFWIIYNSNFSKNHRSRTPIFKRLFDRVVKVIHSKCIGKLPRRYFS